MELLKKETGTSIDREGTELAIQYKGRGEVLVEDYPP
jgi:hypothetical protein